MTSASGRTLTALLSSFASSFASSSASIFAWISSVLLIGLGGSCLQDLPPNAAPATTSGFCGDGYIDLDAGEQCDPGPNAGAASLGVCTADCQVECGAGLVWPANHHCYQVAATAADLDPDAITECSGGHVVTFGSEAEFSAVAAAANVGPFWVGLTTSATRPYVSEVSYEPGWAATCPGCYAHTPTPDQPLPRYPEGGLASEQCVAAFSDPQIAAWFQYPCADEPNTRVVCEREPVGVQFTDCEAGICVDLVVTHGAKRYVYESAPATADAAEAACKSAGARLVVLQSRDEREQLWRQLSLLNDPPDRVWIGLALGDAGAMDAGDAGVAAWVWEDGTSADGAGAYPSPWGDRQPAVPGVTTRAYLRHSPGDIDDTLARNDESETELPYVCEFASAVPE